MKNHPKSTSSPVHLAARSSWQPLLWFHQVSGSMDVSRGWSSAQTDDNFAMDHQPNSQGSTKVYFETPKMAGRIKGLAVKMVKMASRNFKIHQNSWFLGEWSPIPIISVRSQEMTSVFNVWCFSDPASSFQSLRNHKKCTSWHLSSSIVSLWMRRHCLFEGT